MNLTTIFLTRHGLVETHTAASFTDPYSPEAEGKMRGHLLGVLPRSIMLSEEARTTEDFGDFLGEIDSALDGTEWRLFVVDSELDK